ncbi:hypothetical protein ACETU7_08955 [Rhodococcus sp. 3Y1]
MVSWPMLSTGTFTVVSSARPTARNARIATSEHITPKKIRIRYVACAYTIRSLRHLRRLQPSMIPTNEGFQGGHYAESDDRPEDSREQPAARALPVPVDRHHQMVAARSTYSLQDMDGGSSH